jgi:hypothetical protein
VLQGSFGIIYIRENNGLLRPKLFPDFDEIDFVDFANGYSGESLPAIRDECLPAIRCKVYQRLPVDNPRMLVLIVQ